MVDMFLTQDICHFDPHQQFTRYKVMTDTVYMHVQVCSHLGTLCVETAEVFPTYHAVTIFTASQGHHTSDDQPAVPFRIETFSGLMIISVCVLMAIVRRIRKVA